MIQPGAKHLPSSSAQHAANDIGGGRAKASIPQSLVPALDRGLSVLELLANRRIGLRAIDMAQELKVPKNSLSRILQALVDRGYLDRDETTKTFTLTQKLLAIGSATVCESHLIEESLEIMRSLRDQTLEMVLLNVPLNHDEGVVLNTMPSRHQVRLMVDPGTHFEFHNTAPGKVVLAFVPEKERGMILARIKLVRSTHRTLSSKAALCRELEEIREQGFALDRGEYAEGIHCVSAPVFDRNKTFVAALTITGPSTRLPVSKLKELAPLVVSHANAVSRRLGYEWTGPISIQQEQAR
ncbi:MAG: IclR family transcriptional regulator [Verrucomicrobia bacterium]|nr:IclR family transcriptional regulator [Verrucomicrobiota bacterium]